MRTEFWSELIKGNAYTCKKKEIKKAEIVERIQKVSRLQEEQLW
jgi:hypothetical protein